MHMCLMCSSLIIRSQPCFDHHQGNWREY